MAKKTLVIGMGSSGCDICESLVRRIEGEFGDINRTPWIKIIGFDTKSNLDSYLGRKRMAFHIGLNQTVYQEMVSNPKSLDKANHFTDWINLESLKRCNASDDGAGNIRMIGRATFLHPEIFQKFSNAVETNLNELIKLEAKDALKAIKAVNFRDNEPIIFDDEIQVFVCGALTGGTFSGTFIDIGYYLMSLGFKISVVGLVTIPHSTSREIVSNGNAYAALSELNHFHHDGVIYSQKFPTKDSVIKVPYNTPYKSVFILQPSSSDTKEGPDSPIKLLSAALSQFIFSFATSNAGAEVLAKIIDPAAIYKGLLDEEGRPQSFITLGTSVIEFPAEHIINACSYRLAYETLSSLREEHPDFDSNIMQFNIRNDLRLKPDEFKKQLKKEPIGTPSLESRITNIVEKGAHNAKKGDRVSLEQSENILEEAFYHKINAPDNTDLPTGFIDDTLKANATEKDGLQKRTLQNIEKYIRDGLQDLDKGMHWCELILTELVNIAEIELGKIKEGHYSNASTLMQSCRSIMNETKDKIDDAENSKIVNLGLIYKKTALAYLANVYSNNAITYWMAKVDLHCEPYEKQIWNEILLFGKRCLKRLNDNYYGLKNWSLFLMNELKQRHEELDNQKPVVNGELFFVANSTVETEYDNCVSDINSAKNELIQKWTWILDELLSANISAFDEPNIAEYRNKPKPLKEDDIERITKLGRTRFEILKNRNILEYIFKGDKPEECIRSACNKSKIFLDISNTNAVPGNFMINDKRTPYFAFYKGANIAGEGSLQEQFLKSLVQKPDDSVDIDETFRAVLVDVRAIFSLASIAGCNPDINNDFYDAYKKRDGMHSRNDVRWYSLDGTPKFPDFNLIKSYALAGIAYKIISKSGNNFVFLYTPIKPGETAGQLILNNELNDMTYDIIERDSAKTTLVKGIKNIQNEKDLTEQAKILRDFIEKIANYNINDRGNDVTPKMAYRLLNPYIITVPGLDKALRELYGDDDSNKGYHYVIENVEKHPIEKYPIVPGYYCNYCINFLADHENHIPNECPKCNITLL